MTPESLGKLKWAAAGVMVLGVVTMLGAERLSAAHAWLGEAGSLLAIVAAAVYFLLRIVERRRRGAS